ncbi:MAG TPA: hypothetical protein PKH69_07195 [Thiobacillaceae bacterium]|nr:hypothetical protein [Thiobacillaceae bacterium]HNU63722.1 hypothetical protein [Thiobacillaceae bacterium]
MLALRLLLLAGGGLLILGLLGYALSQDRRWLRYTGILGKALLALLVLLLLALLLERLLLVL